MTTMTGRPVMVFFILASPLFSPSVAAAISLQQACRFLVNFLEAIPPII
ncbi:hypothetical protein [Noviherbaspirillum galbum]|uniref:Uncharacterized protein n=1 Tax=Noviherbaspirillum galbum TaxID=2709383 RepID=A0A6B3SGT2_9BURK|nr:hypothetical protein [Noviherbaspirillum galbum]NEX59840.1 hypothetical protein [Noviherbaspirillum galbum]